MSHTLSELCTLFVNDLYGELSSRVLSILLQYGRSTTASLLQYSGLSLKQLKHTLAVLIQQNLATHYTDDGGRTFYEAKWQQAYAIARVGKAIQLIEERHGESSGSIAANLLLLGHTQVKDLADAYGVNRKTRQNGSSKRRSGTIDEISSMTELHSKLMELERAGFITRIHERHFRSDGDTHNEAVAAARQQLAKEGKTIKKPEERELVMTLKRKWRDGKEDEIKPSSKLNMTKIAALDGDQQPARKRRRINGAAAKAILDDTDDYEDTAPLLSDNVVFGINFEKCEVALRNQLLVRFASRFVGESTGKVYDALLRCLESQISRCRDELSVFENDDEELESLPWASTRAVMVKLDSETDLRVAHSDRNVNGHAISAGKNASDEFNYQINGRQSTNPTDTDEDPKTSEEKKQLQLVEEHLQLLAITTQEFVTQLARGKWKVNFRPLMLRFQRYEMDEIIKYKFGDYGAKVVRLLRDKGRLEEKQVCTCALLRPKDLRRTLALMQQAGYLDNQEIPKDTTRQPSRTIYLWFFDEDRVRQLILNDIYKSMSRILQRNTFERSVVQSVIDKAERTDVKGNEDELLTTVEKTALAGWLNTEAQLLTQLGRQDDIVAILRDFVMLPLAGSD